MRIERERFISWLESRPLVELFHTRYAPTCPLVLYVSSMGVDSPEIRPKGGHALSPSTGDTVGVDIGDWGVRFIRWVDEHPFVVSVAECIAYFNSEESSS